MRSVLENEFFAMFSLVRHSREGGNPATLLFGRQI
jgi:hypothetical protein